MSAASIPCAGRSDNRRLGPLPVARVARRPRSRRPSGSWAATTRPRRSTACRSPAGWTTRRRASPDSSTRTCASTVWRRPAHLAEACPFSDCSHVHEPRCAVLLALAEGRLDQARFDNFLKLRREFAYEEARTDGQAARERKEQERRIHRIYQKQHRKQRRRDGS